MHIALNYCFISPCTFGWWSCLSQVGSGVLPDACDSTGAPGCYSVTPPLLLIVVTLSRLLHTSLGEAVQLQREWAVSPPALLPAVPHKPSQSFQAYTGRRRSSAGILLSLEGSECPSVSEIRNRAEVTMKLPLPAASRQWRLYPVSGTELFPAHLHPHSSFQTGAEPCSFLLVDFFQFPCCPF